MYIHTYVYMCIYIYIYTYIDVYIPRGPPVLMLRTGSYFVRTGSYLKQNNV